jgi:hypothetical protein
VALLVVLAAAVAPIVPRTGQQGVLGSGRFVYYLWTDFIFFGAAMFAAAFGCLRRVEPQLVKSLLWLTGVQYVALGVAMLRGDQMTISYLGAGTTWIKALLLIFTATAFLHEKWTRHALIIMGVITVTITLWLAWRESVDDPVIKSFLNQNYGTVEHVAASESAALAGSTFRVAGSFDRNPHGLALFLMMLTAGVSAAIATGLVASWLMRGLMVLVVGLGFYLLLTTLSTLGAVATVAALLVVTMWKQGRPLARVAWVLPLVAAVFYVMVLDAEGRFARYLNIGFALAGGDVTSGALSSGTDRLEAWRSVSDWLDRDASALFFGVGPSGLVRYARERPDALADSDYVFLWLTTGLVGVFLYLSALRLWWRLLAQRLSDAKHATLHQQTLVLWAMASLAGMAVAGWAGPFVTSEAFARNNLMFWLLLAFSLDATAGDA